MYKFVLSLASCRSISLALFITLMGGCTTRAPVPELSEADRLGLALFRLAQLDRYLVPQDIGRELPVKHELLIPKNPYPLMIDWRYNARADGAVQPIITMVRYRGPDATHEGQMLEVGWTGCADINRLSRVTGLKPTYVDLPQVFDIAAQSMVIFSVETQHMKSEIVGAGKGCVSGFSVVKRSIDPLSKQ